ncbi:short subunit dehydrogenase [Paraburkholderia sp. RAU2J]|uniref:SDR family NAD(P)-dependent oxidoreductase n=1 Tax=Paraburkholderia sp. RAU2J TaxID=1938810 RepID=UPI000F183600|nr:SDR family NAD(P)-dependent oxidoreductase [Paraburkholderia sp. RAU2J]RKT10292.1 short subunit dehydrogenase [Paraburkholderia sp. RAU2J]
MSAALELQDLRALVTGGTKGIGKAVVAHLCEAGANVLATARSRPDDLPEERFIGADITTAEGCKTIVDPVLERLGGVQGSQSERPTNDAPGPNDSAKANGHLAVHEVVDGERQPLVWPRQ